MVVTNMSPRYNLSPAVTIYRWHRRMRYGSASQNDYRLVYVFVLSFWRRNCVNCVALSTYEVLFQITAGGISEAVSQQKGRRRRYAHCEQFQTDKTSERKNCLQILRRPRFVVHVCCQLRKRLNGVLIALTL